MDHSCYRCGASVEEGVAFCPNCNAPQIRVVGPEPSVLPEPASDGTTAPPISGMTSLSVSGIEWSQALPAAATSGLFAAVLMISPFGAFGLGALAGGFLSVFLYRRRNPVALLTPRIGGRLGAVTGIFAFAIRTLLLVVFNAGGQIRQAMLEAIQKYAVRNPDPQSQQVLEFFQTPQGFALIMALGLVMTLVFFVILSGLGGALGVAVLRRKK